jgi:geranylgeranyl diphosphate synthase type II
MMTLDNYREIVEDHLPSLLEGGSPEELYEPIRYVISLGGKRLRPVIALAACDLCGGKQEDVLHPALGLEVFHNFTLLHDDIMDAAPIRRGAPTVHIKWDANRAILSGDTMFALAGKLMLQTKPACIPAVMSLFFQTATEVCEGQQWDMNFETRTDVSTGEYLEMIRLKTAVLLAASLKTGAIIGGAQAALADRFYDFGLACGMAFQLQDDWLDTFGDEASFGKKTGGDIVANKKTYLYLRALELADDLSRKDLLHWYAQKPEDPSRKIKEVIRIFNSLGMQAEMEKMMDLYRNQALEELDQIRAEIGGVSILESFASAVIRRQQ